MNCDIILPAYNSARTLPLAMAALFEQRLPVPWQARIIISDDGSTDATPTVAEELAHKSDWEMVVLSGEHAGAAAARNRALDQSTADVVLFTQADIILRPGALAAHLTFHRSHPAVDAGALGWVVWDPRVKPTALMEWMIHGGSQNDYDSLLSATLADPRHFFYGANVSVKRAIIDQVRFSEVFAGYGWEDLDFGRQLAERGLKLTVLPNALGLHHHRYTATDVVRRQLAVGHGLPVYQRRYPDVSLVPTQRHNSWVHWQLYRLSGASRIVRWLVARFPGMVWPRLFSLLCRDAFWAGLASAEK